MDMRPNARQLDQLALRQRYEQNLDIITDIFMTYKEDDYRHLVPDLLAVFKEANPYLSYGGIERSLGYAIEDKIKHSLEFTIKQHLGQYRDSGVHYASHPIHNGYLMAEFGFGEELIISANLHDVPEEHEHDVLEVMDEILVRFGQEVLDNVMALSIFERGELRDEMQMETLWRVSEMRNNYDVFYLKLVDVISNLYTKKHMRGKNGMTAEERQRKYSLNVQKNILPVARLVDDSGELELCVHDYLRDLIAR